MKNLNMYLEDPGALSKEYSLNCPESRYAADQRG